MKVEPKGKNSLKGWSSVACATISVKNYVMTYAKRNRKERNKKASVGRRPVVHITTNG